MKRINFGVVMIIMCLFTSCGKVHTYFESPDAGSYTIEGYDINNYPVNQSEATHSIDELKNFFSSSSVHADNILYLEDIDARFPIKYLRKANSYDSYYIAYPVLEGGKFLVFLNTQIDFGTGSQKLFYATSMYAHNLPIESDFDELGKNSTYNDVLSIAPSTILNAVRSSSIDSYSLLRDGQVLRCTYLKSEGGLLLLECKEVISSEHPDFPFSGMVNSDLVE